MEERDDFLIMDDLITKLKQRWWKFNSFVLKEERLVIRELEEKTHDLNLKT